MIFGIRRNIPREYADLNTRKVLYIITFLFCNAGKDRTGVVSAIILKRMGFDDAQIIADYMETKTNLMPFLQEYSERHPEVDLRTIIPSEENIKAVLALY